MAAMPPTHPVNTVPVTSVIFSVMLSWLRKSLALTRAASQPPVPLVVAENDQNAHATLGGAGLERLTGGKGGWSGEKGARIEDLLLLGTSQGEGGGRCEEVKSFDSHVGY